jgi:rRNA-processing protein FCF1
MKVKKAKNIRKYLRFYKIIFGITDPYHVLLDGNFIFAALKFKLPIIDRLKAMLQGCDFRLYALQSAYDELVKAGKSCLESAEFLQENCIKLDDKTVPGANAGEKLLAFLGKYVSKFAFCGHIVFADSNSKDIHSKGHKHFFVATQDRESRLAVNRMPGIPTMYLSQVVLVMEAPSDASRVYNKRVCSHSSISATVK